MKIKNLVFLLFSFLLFNQTIAQLRFTSINFDVGVNYGKPQKNENNNLGNTGITEAFESKGSFLLNGTIFTNVSPRIAVGIGIEYSRISYTHQINNLIFGQDVIDGTTTSIKNRMNIENIGVPLLAQYDLLSGKSILQCIVGITFHRVFSKSKENEITGGGVNEPGLQEAGDLSNKFNVSSQIGLRLLLPISKCNHFAIGGRIEYFLKSDDYYFLNKKGSVFGKTLYISTTIKSNNE